VDVGHLRSAIVVAAPVVDQTVSGGHLRSASVAAAPVVDQTVSGGHLRSASVSTTFTPTGTTPGSTCATAGTIPLSTPYTGNIASGSPPSSDWFKITLAPGTYKGLITINSGFFGGAANYTGSCPTPTPFIPSFSTLCNTITIATTTTLLIVISGPFSGTTNYTFEIRSGSCPW
jgi:hypothetical protein